MKETLDPLLAIREKIDKIDKAIYQLIKERAEVAQEVAIIKQASQPDAVYYRPEREAQILRLVMEKNDSLLSDRSVAQIFRDIMTACLALQKPQTIGYLGPKGTFSQIAAEKHFGKDINSKACSSIEDIFRDVETEQVHYGVVPIENTTEGTVNLTLDAFLSYDVQICGEIELPIHHQLMTQTGNTQIDCIYSHQQSLAQCRQWISQNHPTAKLIAVESNGEAAKLASLEDSSAAIASELAAEVYDLDIIAENIEDHRQNTTRFLILGKQAVPLSGQDKTSLLISTPHAPGSLHKLLRPFTDNDINMTLIESRPYRHRNWSYLFFIDIEGHQSDDKIKKAIRELGEMSVMMSCLGSYPQAVV